MITPDALIAQAREWLGVRFLHQGRTRMGCDCLGFIGGMLAELGCTVGLENLPLNYARNPQALLVDTLNRVTHTIELQPAALVLIQFPNTSHPSHAGIFTGSTLIHCYQGVGRVVEHGYQRPWIKRTAGFWAIPMVMYE
jgi:cell wall-associated NlpC family hydrolase